MNRILISILSLCILLVCCQNPGDKKKQEQKILDTQTITDTNNLIDTNAIIDTHTRTNTAVVTKPTENLTCEQLLIHVVRSSNFKDINLFGKEDIKIRIDDMTPEKATIKLYVVNEVSENSSEQRLKESAVGWLSFDWKTSQLLDITNDPENPKILKYDKKLLEGVNLSEVCDL